MRENKLCRPKHWRSLLLLVGAILCHANPAQALQIVDVEANFEASLESTQFPANSSFPVTLWLKRDANDPPGQSVSVRLSTTGDYPAIDTRQTVPLSTQDKITAVHFSVRCPAMPHGFRQSDDDKVRIEVTEPQSRTLLAQYETLLDVSESSNLYYLEAYPRTSALLEKNFSDLFSLEDNSRQSHHWRRHRVSTASLPESTISYGTTGAVVLNGDPIQGGQVTLKWKQWKALTDFVRGGGLVIFPDPRTIKALAALSSEPFLSGYPLLTLLPEGASRLTRYGRGGVLVCDHALLQDVYTEQSAGLKTLRSAYLTLHSNGFSPIANLKIFGEDNYTSGLEDALAGSAAGKTPPFWAVAGFLFVYVGLLVPVNYFLLKKYDRRELAWITVPLLAIQFSGVAYLLGRSLKASPMTANRLSVWETDANHQNEWTGYGQFSLYSDRRGKLDLDANALSITPISNAYAQVIAPPKYVRDQTDPENERIFGFPTRQWEPQRFEVDLPASSFKGDGIEAKLLRSNDFLTVTLTNRTAYTLKRGVICFGNDRLPFPTLEPGGSASLKIRNAIFRDTDNSSTGSPVTFSDLTLKTDHHKIEEALVASLKGYGVATVTKQSSELAYIAFFDGSAFPVNVNGKTVPGESANLLFVRLPDPLKNVPTTSQEQKR